MITQHFIYSTSSITASLLFQSVSTSKAGQRNNTEATLTVPNQKPSKQVLKQYEHFGYGDYNPACVSFQSMMTVLILVTGARGQFMVVILFMK